MRNKKLLAALGCMALAAMLVFSGCQQLGSAEPPAKNIVKPYISIQPRSASYHTNDTDIINKLGIEIWDWKDADGTLSSQWYTFNTIEDYITGTVTELQGTDLASETDSAGVLITKTELTLSITPTAGTKYYYVAITNKKPDAGDMTQATVKSEVAAISFSAPGEPLTPIIVRNPVSAAYGWGAVLNSLRVEAVRGGRFTAGEPSYQWYTNDRNSATGGTPITDETLNFLLPDYDDLKLGDNFYYVEVKDGTAVTKSIPAVITMEPGTRAAAPIITVQPQDKLYFIGETFQPLTAAGESPDRGTISYQWYSNTTETSTRGTALSGATSASYTPAVSNSAAGNYFYYAVVTNTNNNVRGTKTATTASKPVRISVASPVGETQPVNLYMTIPDPGQSTNRFQYIRGYGGMDVAWGNFPRTTQADTELMYDPDRLGYNMLRIMIRADNTDPSQTIAELVAGDRPDYYENVKIVNKYGGYVAASPWTPPKDWKSNNSINGGGYLLPRYYSLFAQYLRNFAQNMYDNGAPIYCISISNEPNYVAGYDGCEWEPEEMRDFFLDQGRFTEGIRGWGGGREIPTVLTMNGESANTPTINNAALRDERSKAVIDVLARHIYGSRRDSLWNDNKALITKRDAEGNDMMMEVWMTEHNINSANATGYYNDSTWNYVWRFMNDVDLVIRLNNENAFVWWASKRFYSMVGDGQFGTTDGAPLPRGWGLSHYARFTAGMNRIRINLDTTRPNVTRDGATIGHQDRATSNLNRLIDDMDNDSVRITAFVSADGNEISMVLWTPTKTDRSGGFDVGTVRVALPADFVVNGVTAVRSFGGRAGEIFQPYNVQLNQDRSMAYITMGKSEIVSVKFTK
jgi:O-glycosyl hydrolase